MTPDEREWIDALRSGEFKQGRGGLASKTSEGGIFYCCLGVRCELDARRGLMVTSDGLNFMNFDEVGQQGYKNQAVPCGATLNRWQMTNDEMNDLVKLNDACKMSFVEIANYIEERYRARDAAREVNDALANSR